MNEINMVSVITPVYNRLDYLEETIDSVLKQSYTDFEFLIIDDYSTQNIEEFVSGYSDPRIKFLNNNRKKGAQGARNTGLIESKGRWIAFLDSDDIWMPDKLDKQLEVMISSGSKFSFTNWYVKSNEEISVHKNITGNIYKSNFIGTFSSVVICSDLISKVGLLDEDLVSCQDWDYWIRVLKYQEALHIEEPLLIYRKVGNKKISNNDNKKISGREKLLQKYEKEFLREGFMTHQKFNIAVIKSDYSLLLDALREKKSVYQILRFLYFKFNKIL